VYNSTRVIDGVNHAGGNRARDDCSHENDLPSVSDNAITAQLDVGQLSQDQDGKEQPVVPHPRTLTVHLQVDVTCTRHVQR